MNRSRYHGRKRNVTFFWCVAFSAFWAAAGRADWPQFRGDRAHTATAPLPAGIVLVPAWTVSVPTVLRDGVTHPPTIVSSPAVAGGTVFAGSRNGRFYAWYASTGALRWERDLGAAIDASPLVADGRVYVAATNGKLHALDAANGDLVWTHVTGGGVDRASPNLAAGNVIGGAGFPARAVFGVPAASADPASAAWRFDTQQYVSSSPAVDGSTGAVYVGSNDGRLYALKPDGTALWDAPFATVGGVNRFSPSLANGKVYFCGGDYDWALHAIDAATGAEVWTAPIEPLPVLPSWANRAVQPSSPACDGEFVAMVAGYGRLGAGPSTLYAWRDEGASAKLLWTLAIPNSTSEGFVSSPALTPRHVIVGSAASFGEPAPNGRVYVADRRDGRVVWYRAPGPVLSSPAVAGGAIFVGDNSGALTRFDARLAGDLDADGAVTVLDTLRALSTAAGGGAGDAGALPVADVAPHDRAAPDGSRSFGDALLTPADADRILAYAVGGIDRLP